MRGHVEARRSAGYRWRMEVAPGAEPADGEFTEIGAGEGTAPQDRSLGTIDLRRLPESFWAKAFSLSQTKTLETNEAYTVTLRLRVTDREGRVGEDRRTIAVHHDPSWRAGFPLRLRAGGEAQPQLYDLQGTGRLAAIFGDSDGLVHAIDMVRGRELPGWPARTASVRVTRRHRGISPGREPVVANAAIGDLDGGGRPTVVVTSTSGRVYAFDARGHRRRGWPRTMATGVEAPPIPRKRLPFTRLPHRGAFAPPLLADLDLDGRLEVVQAGWDGRVHAWRGSGRELPGWPVEVRVAEKPADGYFRIDDRKLEAAPALAQLDRDPEPEIVVRSQQADTRGVDIQPLGRTYTSAFNHDGTPVKGWPVQQSSTIMFYGSAQEFITEASTRPWRATWTATGATRSRSRRSSPPPRSSRATGAPCACSARRPTRRWGSSPTRARRSTAGCRPMPPCPSRRRARSAGSAAPCPSPSPAPTPRRSPARCC